jgi:predicted metalloendopeptidase
MKVISSKSAVAVLLLTAGMISSAAIAEDVSGQKSAPEKPVSFDFSAIDTSVDGYTPAQRFFLGFGQVWCQNQSEQAARLQAKTNPHSTGECTNGSVQNFDAFGKVFGCKVGQPMMPTNGCRVW